MQYYSISIYADDMQLHSFVLLQNHHLQWLSIWLHEIKELEIPLVSYRNAYVNHFGVSREKFEMLRMI